MFTPLKECREVFPETRGALVQCDAASPSAPLQSWYGRVRCVYADPPFMTGKAFPRRRPLGQESWRQGRMDLTLPGFADRFDSPEEYDRLLRGLILQGKALLDPRGVFCLHLDWRASARARQLCDEIFGPKLFLNEIIWAYETGGRSTRTFSRKHDTILMYGASRKYEFDITRVPLSRPRVRRNHMRVHTDSDGRVYRSIRSGSRVYTYYDDAPAYPGDVWTDISHLQQRDPERTGWPTQKPQRLLDRLIRPVCSPGDLVADLCCGSGTALAAADALGCGYLGCDLSPQALHICAGRLGEGYDLQSELSMESAGLSADYDPAGRVLTLREFGPPGSFPAAADPLSALEQFRLGSWEDGVMTVRAGFARSRTSPAMPAWFVVPPECGDRFAVTATDAAGNRYAWRYDPEEP